MWGLFSLKANCKYSPQYKLSGSHRGMSASCKLGGTLLCLVNERLGEMLLNGGSGGNILEAKGSY